MPKPIKIEEIMQYMQEFVESKYDPHSGFSRDGYGAAQEATSHWLKYIKQAQENNPNP